MTKRSNALVLGLLGALLLALLIAVVAVVPTWLAWNAFAGSHTVARGDQWAVRVSDERRAVLWMLGGLIAVTGLLYTHRRHRLNEIQHELTRDENRTTRYTAAVGQIGDDSIDVRLGGIYALERLARDSVSDRETVWEVVSAFIREHTRGRKPGEEMQTDVAAAIAVVTRNEVDHIDLSGADLRGAELVGADFRGARLDGAILDGLDLTASLLSGVQARRASFVGARLLHAYLVESDLSGSNLTDALLFGANLDDSRLVGCNLTRANLQQASLKHATLWNSIIKDAQVRNADFAGADLTGVEIHGAISVELAKNLSQAENVAKPKTTQK